jgi:aquaporin Z
MEAALLGLFMVSAGGVGVLLEAPGSPARAAIASADLRRALAGVAMGLTAVALVYSPWGRRSGAHMNPALTLAFLALRKVAPRDAAAYAAAQVAGGLAGVALVAAVAGAAFREPPVRYVVTEPGPLGAALAFGGEAAISFLQMTLVLVATNTPRLAPFTGLLAGCGVALYIAVEAPLSGMSMNPARTLASALPAGALDHLWIYLVAPPLGMLAAARVFLTLRGAHGVECAKLQHDAHMRCIFCGHEPERTGRAAGAPGPADARPAAEVPGS